MTSLDRAGRWAVQCAAIASMALLLGVGGCSASSGGAAPPAQPAPTSSVISTTPSPSLTASATASAFKQDPVDAAFANKMGALCNEWNSFASTHQYPGAANAQAATVEELPKIAAWIDSLTINHELLAKATALGTPATGQASWPRVLEDFASYEKAVATAATTAKSGGLRRGSQQRPHGRPRGTPSVRTSSKPASAARATARCPSSALQPTERYRATSLSLPPEPVGIRCGPQLALRLQPSRR